MVHSVTEPGALGQIQSLTQVESVKLLQLETKQVKQRDPDLVQYSSKSQDVLLLMKNSVQAHAGAALTQENYPPLSRPHSMVRSLFLSTISRLEINPPVQRQQPICPWL